MTRLVPVGYLTFREAVIWIEHAMFAWRSQSSAGTSRVTCRYLRAVELTK